MARCERILDRFQWFYRAADSTKLLHHVVGTLAGPLEEADTHLLRIQRAHRLRVAEFTEDIVRLAGVLNLSAFHFEDIQSEETLSYEQKLELMRARVQRVARLHLRGLGTPWAVLEAAAIFMNGIIVPERNGDPLIKHLDGEGHSHKAVVEFAHRQGAPRERIYLHEQLFHREKIEPVDRWQLNSWSADNKNPDPAPARFVIAGVRDHTVRPSIFCPATGEGLVFDGVVPEAATLVIDAIGGAHLEGVPVDEWMIAFKGGIYDFGRADDSSFAVDRGGTAAPFLGVMEDVTASAVRTLVDYPVLPVGRSEWFFKVATGLYDGSDFDLCVFEPGTEPVGQYEGDAGFDQCVFDFPSAGLVGMGWDQSIPCSFKLTLPATIAAGDATRAAGKGMNHVSRVSAVLPAFKAAGVRAVVDVTRDCWILGESVVRAAAATEGDGLTAHVARLRHLHADRLVPLDPARAGS